MSKSMVKDRSPRNTQVVDALRRELNRNTQRISQKFWQEFELIRNQQRTQLEEERRSRERITTLMRDTNLEVQQQVEALSRSISSHGVNPAAPSPSMRRGELAIMPPIEEEELPTERKTAPIQPNEKRSGASVHRQRRPPSPSVQQPRAPPSYRATIIPSRTPSRSSPVTSKVKLADKPKK